MARSVRELVQRVQRRSVGRSQLSIGESATARILTTTTGSSQAQTLEEEMGSRFPQCRRGRPYPHTQALQASRFNPYNRRGPPPSRISSNQSTGKAFTSLVPRPLPTREKGLVHTDCACARLYPESGYIVYSRKILSKLSIYDYVIFSISSRLANKHTRRAQRLRSSG